jgi:DNA-binding CsgD family transcriptional regulator
MTDQINDQILKRLDQILRILALQVSADKSLTERIGLLALAGLDNATIAQVLNTSPAVVRTLKSDVARRAGRSRRRGRKRPPRRTAKRAHRKR